MNKAYDVKDLAQKLKKEGLNVAEDEAKAVVKVVSAWVQESAKLSATPFDDIALVVLPQVEKLAMAKLDLIDGEVG